MDECAKRYYLALYQQANFKLKNWEAFFMRYHDIRDCFYGDMPRQDFVAWCAQHKIQLETFRWKAAERELLWLQTEGGYMVCYQDPEYPEMLKNIAFPPPILFVKGNTAILRDQLFSIVGSRKATLDGRKNAYHFAYMLAQWGVGIVSGLALGIDTQAHRGALAAQGVTIAVMGNGLAHIYPKENEKLLNSIEEKGAVVSEFLSYIPPKPWHFPRRNRLISGIALGVLVVEAALKGGSLLTARYGLEQGKEIFALPGSILNPMAQGCHQLIRHGAKCVDGVEHILEEFPIGTFKKVPAVSSGGTE